MPYNADLLQHYPDVYSNHQFRQPQNATSNTPVQHNPIEVTVPQHINHLQPAQQGYYVNQQAFPQIGYHPQAPVQGQYLQWHGSQETTALNRHVLGPRQPSIQVEVPARTAKETQAPPVDKQVLLLFLAEEYLEAAHNNGMLKALVNGEAQIDDYYKLVSTALGCMETVLKRFRLPPLKEAHLRLRFSRTLYEETENDLEAETALSRGIDLCERNKLLDMKYTMQTLLSRVLYRSNPRAAAKAIDVVIEDVAAYRHVAWEYAFRFLRVMLSLSLSSHQDYVPAVHQLQKIANLAHRRSDHAVFAFASVTEALTHLQNSGPDSIDQAQRALAAARQAQLNEDVNSVPQIQVLVQYVDLCCSLRESNLEHIGQKLSTMQQTMDHIVDDTSWLEDGSFFLPLTRKSGQDIPLTGGGIVQERNGKLVLALTWLPKKDIYTVGYFLSAVATSQKNAQNDHKAELFIDEGLALLRSSLDVPKVQPEPLPSSMARRRWRETLECQFLLEKGFLLCARSEWGQARILLSEVESISSMLQAHMAPEFLCLWRYLTGTICQGTGDLNQALTIFLGDDLALPPSCNKNSYGNIRRDIALLAAINAIFVIRSPSHPSHHLLPSILSTIDPYLLASPNKHLLASRSLLISNLPQSVHHLLTTDSLSSTLLIKKHLSMALNIAKTIGNAQITAMTLSVMSAKFFKGVVGEQAEKSARAGQNMAYKSGMRLWMSASNGMLAETLERQGKSDEAGRVRAQALRLAGMMPKALQRSEGDEGVDTVANTSTKKTVAEEEDDDKDELA